MNDWYEKARQRAQAWSDAIFQSVLTEAVFAAWIKLPLQDEIAFLCGYNPQKLLPPYPLMTGLSYHSWVASDGSYCSIIMGQMRIVERDDPLAAWFDIPLGEPYKGDDE